MTDNNEIQVKAALLNCPFCNDTPVSKGWLGAERMTEIYTCLEEGGVFPCHKTIKHGELDDYDEDDTFIHQESHQFCAGALIMLEKTGDANKSRAIQIAERLGLYDKDALKMDSPVFESKDELIEIGIAKIRNRRKYAVDTIKPCVKCFARSGTILPAYHYGVGVS